MTTLSNEELLKQIDVILSENKLNLEDKDIVLQRCFTESWFSDTLAWLLNPKGSHGFGVEFANEFLKVIAQERSKSGKEYKSKASMLGWGKNRGTSSLGFSLKNASSIREFYLSRPVKKSSSRNARYCDVVFIDLDPADGLFLVVENKLFTSNHPNQLEEYYELVEEKFSRAKIREYVYLTIDGLKPHEYRENDEPLYRYWVNLSWIRHIKELVNICSSNSPHPDVELLSTLLTWLNKLKGSANNNIVEGLRNLILLAAAECLNEELNRLGEGKSGSWSVKKENMHHITIVHSSSERKPLYIELLPNFTITVQSRRKAQALFEKIIVPFGIHTDQVFNLIDIAARDIYYNHFGDSVDLYLSDNRRLTATVSAKKEEHTPIFNYVFKHQHELKIILASSKHIQDALLFEFVSPN